MYSATILMAHLLVMAVDVPPSPTPPPAPALLAPGSQFGSMEDRILSGLDLTQDQRKQLAEAAHTNTTKYKQLREQYDQDGDLWAFVRGQNATANWSRSETQRILTKEQHVKYIEEWYQSMAPYFGNSKKIQGRIRMMAPAPKDGASKPPTEKK